ncbi:MAG: hypothetical protein ATN35_12870 [Epulopiscium sp. Nele67-Bin004]|nr:MAG: hypothetical protein ATN35_12870 [Epulopiscium sp. Nele67-Bin004]
MRKHYMTICFRGNTEVTYIDRKGDIVVTFEKVAGEDFVSVDIKLDGVVVLNNGFSPADVDYYTRFVLKNANMIKLLASRKDELHA